MRAQPWIRRLWLQALCPAACRRLVPAGSRTRCRHLSSAAQRVQRQMSSPPHAPPAAAASLPSYSFKGKALYHVLGVETTCDETALAILNNRGEALSSVSASQWQLLRQYQGVHPGMAAREHEKNLDHLFAAVLQQSGLPSSSIDIVAVAAGPGLSPCLSVGLSWSSALARSLSSSFIGVHHLLAHALVTQLSHPQLRFPFLSVIVSGGHTEVWLSLSPTSVLILGHTLDDAMGEAMDKAARTLRITPQATEALGAALQRTAAEAVGPAPDTLAALLPLPQPLTARTGCDFSFAGLKTALASRVAALTRLSPSASLSAAETAHLAAAFQRTCCTHIVQRTLRALALARKDHPQVRQLVLAGGVACNAELRRMMRQAMAQQGIEVCIPPPSLCSDNGIMIAWMGVVQAGLGHEDSPELAYQPQWPAGRRLELGQAARG